MGSMAIGGDKSRPALCTEWNEQSGGFKWSVQNERVDDFCSGGNRRQQDRGLRATGVPFSSLRIWGLSARLVGVLALGGHSETMTAGRRQTVAALSCSV
jgi:hypothetical protein